jgi:hypothetical protein
MPGTVVRDSLGPAGGTRNIITGATLNAAGTTNSTVVEVGWPGEVQFYLTTATVTGTSPTLRVLVQGADDSGFSVNAVDIASFDTVGDEDNVVKQLTTYVDKRYIRLSVTVGGTTPVYTGTTCEIVLPHDRRVRATSTA